MREAVAQKGLLGREARPTLEVPQGALVRMHSQMREQRPLPAEAPPTVRTPEAPGSLSAAPLWLRISLAAALLPRPPWLVLQVASLVLLQVVLRPKALPTDSARVLGAPTGGGLLPARETQRSGGCWTWSLSVTAGWVLEGDALVKPEGNIFSSSSGGFGGALARSAIYLETALSFS